VFFENDPYPKSVEQNWDDFKRIINDTVIKNVPHRIIHSHNSLPWINKEIKKYMKKHKQLYNIAKRSKSNNDRNAYRKLKNAISSKLKMTHNNYYGRNLDTSFNGNHRQFWKYIRAKQKTNTTFLHWQ